MLSILVFFIVFSSIQKSSLLVEAGTKVERSILPTILPSVSSIVPNISQILLNAESSISDLFLGYCSEVNNVNLTMNQLVGVWYVQEIRGGTPTYKCGVLEIMPGIANTININSKFTRTSLDGSSTRVSTFAYTNNDNVKLERQIEHPLNLKAMAFPAYINNTGFVLVTCPVSICCCNNDYEIMVVTKNRTVAPTIIEELVNLAMNGFTPVSDLVPIEQTDCLED